jgi:hypothetical protein
MEDLDEAAKKGETFLNKLCFVFVCYILGSIIFLIISAPNT